jgi:Zn-dependent protease
MIIKFLEKYKIEFSLSFLINIGFLAWISISFLNNEVKFELTSVESTIIGIVVISLLIFTLVLHELGHLIGSIIFSNNIKKIRLTCLGGIIYFEDQEIYKDIKKVILILFSGPIANLFVGLVLYLIWLYYSQYSFEIFPIKESLENSISLVSAYNIFIGIINLIPILPFDMGKIINYILIKKFRIGKQFLSNALDFFHNIFYVSVIAVSFYVLINNSNFYGLVLIVYSIMLLNDFNITKAIYKR